MLEDLNDRRASMSNSTATEGREAGPITIVLQSQGLDADQVDLLPLVDSRVALGNDSQESQPSSESVSCVIGLLGIH